MDVNALKFFFVIFFLSLADSRKNCVSKLSRKFVKYFKEKSLRKIELKFYSFFCSNNELVLVQFYDSAIKAGNLTSCTT